MTIRSQAKVGTDKPAGYAKRLSSHLGASAQRPKNPMASGSPWPPTAAWAPGLLVNEPDVLALHAEAENAEVLDRVQDVIGRHLERFGQRDELKVNWTND